MTVGFSNQRDQKPVEQNLSRENTHTHTHTHTLPALWNYKSSTNILQNWGQNDDQTVSGGGKVRECIASKPALKRERERERERERRRILWAKGSAVAEKTSWRRETQRSLGEAGLNAMGDASSSSVLAHENGSWLENLALSGRVLSVVTVIQRGPSPCRDN